MIKNKDLVTREIAGETILVPIGSMAQKLNGMISLNEMAAFIWEHIEEAADFNQLVDMILDEYEVDRETAAADASSFVMQLLQHGMIQPSGLNW